ncbi:PaaI family thioesterase [Erythrobacter crassostreae]|uniref:PaaI family thioesterase n=1 Tax=Erythrobacter crassostreae TaxID=2828328 RepID=A0A9X1F4U4_9SPHN|nr:PaaI family thioesterase [Erythrobacter crassostrea]MBV7259528.1 PaaI family thioesterase [Erythrobacter crassostrea]
MSKLELPPYARALGICAHQMEDGVPVLTVEFGPSVEGRPGHYHGGATAGLLENAGYAALRARLIEEGRIAQLKPVNITVQYLSAGKVQPSFAKGRITRLGRRNANITVEAWQDNRDRPIATAIMNILMA